MDKFQNKYRIPSARLQNWDYGSDGAYFITICTQNREHFFGRISDGQMQLNEIGLLAHNYWLEIPIHFSFIELGNFVVMPNHIHGILIINKKYNSKNTNIEDEISTLQCNVSTSSSKNEFMASISPKPGSIATIIRSFKSAVSKNAKFYNQKFAWQTRFHDHIIRNAQSFEYIQNYIVNNPKKWIEDKFWIQ